MECSEEKEFSSVHFSSKYYNRYKDDWYIELCLRSKNEYPYEILILFLQLNVPATFMLVALDEGPGPPIKYQYPELTKLHQVVSQLIRCCDVSSRTQSSQSQQVG